MKRISLIQIGTGTVGGAVIDIVIANRDRWRRDLGVDVQISSVIRRGGAWIAASPDGFVLDELKAAISSVDSFSGVVPEEAIASIAGAGPSILIDAAAGSETADLLLRGLSLGAGAVLSNKAPLALASSDSRTHVLWSHAGAVGRLRYEATCGAGLPVISTLQSLIDSGDRVTEITGTVSGTYGAIFSSVAGGARFSDAVREAKDRGYTEPDPRDDLSGLDVARKALILARTLGESVDLDEIAVESLVPEALADVSIEAFLDGISEMDGEIAVRAAEASDDNSTLKYMMRWTAEAGVEVGLIPASRSTVLGALQGPENIVSFRTERYDQYPCVVSGPGAGAAVTAGGMVADMLALARQLA